MKAEIDGKHIGLEEIELDDLGWDHCDVRGNLTLTLELLDDDLLDIGRSIFELAEEFREEDPGYFHDEDMDNVPVPESDQLFLEKPTVLEKYLEYSSFWNRFTILALFDRVDTLRNSKSPNYWIQNFQGLKIGNYGVTLKLGVSPGK